MSTGQFELANPPKDAISALRFAPGSSTHLLVSSWDKNVYLYDTRAEEGGKLIKTVEHRAPVLDICFGKDESEAFSGGLDWDVRRINLNTGEQTVLSSHDKAVKSVAYSPETTTLFSASWDGTLHIHSLGADTEVLPSIIQLPSKPFSLSVSSTKLVVAMASRALHIYDLKALALLASQSSANADVLEAEPWQRRESSLKFMTRAVACMPNDAGYASSSIEGRVAVEWFDSSAESQARKYAFKCHRQTAADGADVVYPVNALAFHPVHGSFASGGGDGFVALWDGVAKRRIRQYQRYPNSVASLSFSGDGTMLAVAVCPGFEDGKDDVETEGQVKVFIRGLSDTEAKGKGAK